MILGVLYGMALGVLIVDLTIDTIPDARVTCFYYLALLGSPATVTLIVGLSILVFVMQVQDLLVAKGDQASTSARLVLLQCGMISAYSYLCIPQYARIIHGQPVDRKRICAGHSAMCVLACFAVGVLLTGHIS